MDVTTSWSPLAVLNPAAAVTRDRTCAWLIFLALDELSSTATEVRSTWPGACFTVWVTWPTALVIWELVVVYVPFPPVVVDGWLEPSTPEGGVPVPL